MFPGPPRPSVRKPVVLGCTPGPAGSANMDEELVEPYDLPDPLVFEDGAAVTPATWGERRNEILELFEDHVYGRTPDGDVSSTTDVLETGPALDGAAIRRQVHLTFSSNDRTVAIDVLLYVPARADGPVPAFVVPNFDGNHTIADDPAIIVSERASRDRGDDLGGRGSKAARFPLGMIIERGYGLATFYSGDADSDIDDGFADGTQPLFYRDDQATPEPYEWGTIGAWAWGCSRVLDYLLGVDVVDRDRVIVGGHSRLGKTALWAAAQDQRFVAAFSNDSGCTGAALSRRRFGENVAVINALFPHWFCRNYRCYGNNEAALPVDQHQLIALLAPRPVHIGSASEDAWADPLGEFLAARAASPVFELLGAGSLALEAFPSPGEVSIGTVSYHLREGEHALVEFDWIQYLDFADRHVR